MQIATPDQERNQMQFWKLAANLLRVSVIIWMLIGVVVLPKLPKEPYWTYIIAWGIVFVIPGFLTWILSNRCARKATLLSKHKLKEVKVSEEKKETTIQHVALETDEGYRVDEATMIQEEKAIEIQRKQEIQISPKKERFPQKQRAEAVSIKDSLAGCKHENVMLIPVFQVKGEPRRVIKKCLDCGKILKKDRISR